ncbi:putative membrane protein [Brucella thiophenivorans]|uniref:Putative membrane protein n=1 Tax=Brucella thiophenivorans TaxID=571255 RepID=A0A256FVI6_9HYPH|nr:putative membrane protein [Brucella thiophenivorans]
MEQKINIREQRGVISMTDLVYDVLSFVSVSLFVATFAIWVSAI